ncbi:MAG: hypothetical protein ABII76_24705 [Pseudomonadota bacterium]
MSAAEIPAYVEAPRAVRAEALALAMDAALGDASELRRAVSHIVYEPDPPRDAAAAMAEDEARAERDYRARIAAEISAGNEWKLRAQYGRLAVVSPELAEKFMATISEVRAGMESEGS